MSRRSLATHSRFWFGLISGAALTAMTMVPFAALAQQTTQDQAGDNQGLLTSTIGPYAAPTIDEIVDNPARYDGRQVVIRSEIEELLDSRVFVVEDDDFLFEDEMLVISESALPPNVGRDANAAYRSGDDVTVVGVVRILDRTMASRDLGIDLDDSRYEDWEGTPVLIARRVNLTNATVDKIADNPNRFVGRDVIVRGEIDDVLGPRSFVLEDDDLLFDEEVLVVTTTPAPVAADRTADEPFAGADDVQVAGKVRIFRLTDVEREAGVDLDDAAFAGWDGKPVILASEMRLEP